MNTTPSVVAVAKPTLKETVMCDRYSPRQWRE